MQGKLVNLIFLLLSVWNEVIGGFYLGGTISWEPTIRFKDNLKEINFDFRLSWSNTSFRCSDEALKSQKLVGNPNQKWICVSGCSGSLASTEVKCTGYHPESGSSNGFYKFLHVFTGDNPIEITVEDLEKAERWDLTTHLLLGTRNDTNSTNSSPVVKSPLQINLTHGLSYVINLNILDPDHDVVRCNLKNIVRKNEKSFKAFEEFFLDQETCQVYYLGSESGTIGLLSILIFVEDFNAGELPIRVGNQVVKTGQAISSVPFHFTVNVTDKNENECKNFMPSLNLTPPHNGFNSLRPGMLFRALISGQTCGKNERPKQLNVSSEINSEVSEVIYKANGRFDATLSLRPQRNLVGMHNVCVGLISERGLTSTSRCFNLTVQPEIFHCKVAAGQNYQTFDGYQYNFASSCRYQIATTTFIPAKVKGKNIEPFNISIITSARNLNGSRSIDNIFITIKNFEFKLWKGRRITLFRTRVYPPIRIENIKIDLLGHQVVLSTETGISLSYDGTSSITLTLPQTYMGHIQGLCGNFNSDPNDDYASMNDVTMTRSTSQFRLNDPSCHETKTPVAHDAPTCAEKEQLSNLIECELMVEVGGCFHDCHPLINSTSFYETCKSAFCKIDTDTRRYQLSEYARACQLENVAICDWRKQVGAEMKCPPHSRYALCGASKTMSCANLKANNARSNRCMEGCQCDEGYALAGEKCIPKRFCGCFIKGSYRHKGFVFRTEDCAHECTCVGRNETSCSLAPPCAPNERCGVSKNDFMNCVPRTHKPATCKVIGDPHYLTFDGAVFDSMSTCAHILVRSRKYSVLPPFTVVGINEEPVTNNMVSFVKEVQVSVGGMHAINISLSQGKTIKVNGTSVKPGSLFPGVRFRTTPIFLVVSFDFGLVLRWDGVDRLRISAWKPLQNQVEGLCGNYDGDPNNDYASSDGGGLITNVDHFVYSWLITGRDFNGNFFPEPPQNATKVCLDDGISGALLPSCVELFTSNRERTSCRSLPEGTRRTPCDNVTEERRSMFRLSCEILVDPDGPFNSCHAVSNPFPIYASCIFDLCAYNGNKTIRDRIISSYVVDCAESGVNVMGLKNKTNNGVICSNGSVWSRCVSQCEPSCTDLNGTQCRKDPNTEEFCEEGCKCEQGFVRSPSKNRCIPKTSCGCIINGIYQDKGFTYRQNACSESCECTGSGLVKCVASTSCSIPLRCVKDEFGFEECVVLFPDKSICVVNLNKQIMTYDQLSYNITNLCSHIITRNIEASSPKFAVYLFHYPVNTKSVQSVENLNFVTEIVIQFGINSTLTLSSKRSVKVNKSKMNSNYHSDQLDVTIKDQMVIANFTFGLSVTWDFLNRLNVVASSSLMGQLEGLCGNFDLFPNNDMLSHTGRNFFNINQFVDSWITTAQSRGLTRNDCHFVIEPNSTSCYNDYLQREEKEAQWREETLNKWSVNLQSCINSLRHSSLMKENKAQTNSSCNPKWTDWLDRDTPEGDGDDESLALHLNENPLKICKNPIAIEARLSDGREATLSGNAVQMRPQLGLICYNRDQRHNDSCANFQVRFLCLNFLR